MGPLYAAAFTLCLSFGLFPDNTSLGPSFQLGGVAFRDLGSHPSFVNDTGFERGLQFHADGVEIALPAPVGAVDMRLGTFAGEMSIVAKNPAGAVVATQTVPGLNRFVDVRLVGADIATIALTKGGNEGILARLCVAYSTCR